VATPVVNLAELVWQDLAYGERFAARVGDLARLMGATRLGYNVQEIPPGKVNVPYHTHFVNEELMVVLDGSPHIRLNGAWYDLRPRDVVALPPGLASAHQLLNYSDRPARVLLASTTIPGEYLEYLDSGKRGLGVAGLAREKDREVTLIHEGKVLLPGDPATYFLGEPFDEALGDPPPASAQRDRRIANLDEVPDDPYEIGPFRAGRKRVSRHVGARLLGYSLYYLEPGDRTWPYHFQHANEELALVFAGRAVLRTPEGEREVGPGDAIAFPTGPAGAHGFTAIGDAPFEVFILSTMIEPEISEYPDSEKIYVMVGSAPGGDPAVRLVDHVFRRRDAVTYETDEV
jgi:uncharacterized cupin superfamily protein